MLEIARRHQTVVIEGGSVFYLKHLFKDAETNFDEPLWAQSRRRAAQLLASAAGDWSRG